MKKILTLALTLGFAIGALAAPKKVVMIAGPQSHGPLSHEHRAGILLLAKCLKEGAADLVQPGPCWLREGAAQHDWGLGRSAAGKTRKIHVFL